MMRYLLSSATAWAAVLFLGIEIALPYYLRRVPVRRLLPANSRACSQQSANAVPNLRDRLRPHYWLGYALAGLSTTHLSLVGPAMARSDAAGVWAATFAWGLLFAQIALGLLLQKGGARTRGLRRIHFWSMLALSALVAVHVWRNG